MVSEFQTKISDLLYKYLADKYITFMILEKGPYNFLIQAFEVSRACLLKIWEGHRMCERVWGMGPNNIINKSAEKYLFIGDYYYP